MARWDSFNSTDHHMRAMEESLPDFDVSDPFQVVAGMIYLDKSWGVYSSDNIVVMNPSFAGWFLLGVQSSDPDIAAIIVRIRKAMESDETTMKLEDLKDLQEKLTTHPFRVTFPQQGYESLREITGDSIMMRVMTQQEVLQYDILCATVTPDGRIVYKHGEVSDAQF